MGNNANLLGNITIGENSRVGAGSVVLSDVPPNSTVVGVPAHIVYRNGERVLITDPHDIKDPLSDVLIALSARVRSWKSNWAEKRNRWSSSRPRPPSAKPIARSWSDCASMSPWAKVLKRQPECAISQL